MGLKKNNEKTKHNLNQLERCLNLAFYIFCACMFILFLFLFFLSCVCVCVFVSVSFCFLIKKKLL